jgi:hypothetical protein
MVTYANHNQSKDIYNFIMFELLNKYATTVQKTISTEYRIIIHYHSGSRCHPFAPTAQRCCLLRSRHDQFVC